jgi:gluconolactonase
VITRSGAPFLTGKRLFARAVKGRPKGVICDAKGNVFAGCGDGVEIWNPGGLLLGVISVPCENQRLTGTSPEHLC